MAETRFGTWDELMELASSEVQEIAVALRALVLEVDPEATEVVRLGDKAATYGLGPKKMIEGYCYIMPLKERVNFGFFRGAILEDKHKLLEGTGKSLRHVKVKDLSQTKSLALRKLVEAGFKERIKNLERE